MKPSEIEAAYAHLWNRFRERAKKVKLSAKGLGAGFRIDSKGPEGRVEVRGIFHLSGWPYKASTTRDKYIDILVGGYDSFDCGQSMLCASNIQVRYFRNAPRGETGQSLLEMHYDFDAKQLRAHPLFHAQLGATKFDEKGMKDLGVTAEVEAPSDHLYGALRIPTAHMGFSSVLLGLAATHWNPDAFEDFLDELRKTDLVKWETSCKRLRERMSSLPGYAHSHQWYEREARKPKPSASQT